jgi:CelD/BcsL family acetyltransferase involved in cellulose biosynthesis
MRIDWVSHPGALEALEPAWRHLESAVAARTHLSSFDFLFTWYRRYAGAYGGTPLIGLAWRERELVGIAPLTLVRGTTGRIPVRRVEFAPSDVPAGEFLIRDDDAAVVAALLASLIRTIEFDVLCLDGFDPGSAYLDVLTHAARGHRLAVHTDEHAFALVDLRRGYAAYFAGLSGHYRRNLNGKARKIQASGFQVDWVYRTDACDRINQAIARLIAINEASYKLDGRRLADEHRGFLSDLVRCLASRATLALPILSITGRDAAFILGVVERGCFYDVTLAYDESWAKLSPGAFLMQQTLQRLADAGIHTVVSHGAHEYKKHWATAFVTQRRALLFAPTMRGRAAQLAHVTVRPLLERLNRKTDRSVDGDLVLRPAGAAG